MVTQQTLVKTESNSLARRREAGLALALFLLALAPRGLALQHFVTADEAKWVYRSAQFLGALQQGDLAGTAVNLTPAVTTTWLGSLGLAGYYQLHRAEIGLPLAEWLDALPPFRVDLPVLAAARWPMVIFSALAVVGIYGLAKRLWGGTVALVGALLIALDPHTLSLSRIIGHDAPAAIFMTLSLLALLVAVAHDRPRAAFKPGWLAVSGLLAGLAFLSKSPAFFLIPFTALLLGVKIGQRSFSLKMWLLEMALWGLAAYGVFVALWPAAWLAPLRQPYAVVENAFLSATNRGEGAAGEEEEVESYWLTPDLGPFYYPINGLFKLSPLVTLGLVIGSVLAFRQVGARWRATHLLDRDEFWLGLFVILFIIFMTLGGKRSNRYLLPVFPALAFLAAFSWRRFVISQKGNLPTSVFRIPYSVLRAITPRARRKTQDGIRNTHHAPRATLLIAGILLVSLLTLLPYAPYYFTYFNPLLGGPLVAPRLVKIGWGEGLDEAGRWLMRQPNPASSRAGSWYASALDPFYQGDIADVSSRNLDYVVLYLKHAQGGLPRPEVVQYFQMLEPLHTAQLAGIEYARVYPGPAAQLTPAETERAPGPVAFRPHTPYAPIGQDLTLDLIWAAAAFSPEVGPTVSLRWRGVVMAEAEAFSMPFGLEKPVRRYVLSVPFDLPPDTVDLFAGGQPLGQIQAYHTQPPAYFTRAEVNFAGQVQLVGFAPQTTVEGNTLTVQLAFKANPKAWADYTIFVHLINAAGERLTGYDAPPTPPTSQWARDQVVQASYALPLPASLSPAETYRLRVGLYQAQTGEPLGEGVVLPLEVRLP